MALSLIACGGRAATTDGGGDATLGDDAADASVDGVTDAPPDRIVDMSCNDGSADVGVGFGVSACCGDKLCRGSCSEAGTCECGKVPGGCTPLYCCVFAQDQRCMDYCGAGQ